MKTSSAAALLVVSCIFGLHTNGLGQVGAWPALSGYTYFGTTSLNQASMSNYATLQRDDGLTFLNSPLEIRFRISNNDKMIMTNAGNVGIGTTTPASTLDVIGLTTSQGIRIPGRYTFGYNQSAIEMEVPGDSYNAIRGVSGSQHIGAIHFFDDTWQGGAAASSAGAINLSPLTAVTIGNWSSPMAYFRSSDGSVGIGTSNPNGKLDVVVNNSYQRISGNTSAFVAADLYIQRSSSLPSLGRSSAIQLQDTGSGDQVMLQGGSGGFQVFNSTTSQPWTERLTITHSGNVGIGTTSPDAKLSVKGQVHAQEVKVDLNGAVAPDYVFDKDYKLPSLEEIQSYITANKHLPDVPSAKEMETNGMNLGEMNLLLLKKVEELTLYQIEAAKVMGRLENRIKELENTHEK